MFLHAQSIKRKSAKKNNRTSWRHWSLTTKKREKKEDPDSKKLREREPETSNLLACEREFGKRAKKKKRSKEALYSTDDKKNLRNRSRGRHGLKSRAIICKGMLILCNGEIIPVMKEREKQGNGSNSERRGEKRVSFYSSFPYRGGVRTIGYSKKKGEQLKVELSVKP